MRTTFPPHSRAGFTLIEILAASAIVLVLAGLLIPMVGSMRDKANQSKCVHQLRSAFAAAQLYTAENNGEVVPGSVETEGNATKEFWTSKLVPYFGEENNNRSRSFACPKWKEQGGSATAFNWGYALNLTPLYEGTSTTSAQKATSVITRNADGTITGTIFRQAAITHQSRRLYMCDSKEWQVRGQQVTISTPGQTLASYDRHGKNRCNAMFFDGHIETLTPKGVDSSIFDPANFTNSL